MQENSARNEKGLEMPEREKGHRIEKDKVYNIGGGIGTQGSTKQIVRHSKAKHSDHTHIDAQTLKQCHQINVLFFFFDPFHYSFHFLFFFFLRMSYAPTQGGTHSLHFFLHDMNE